MTRYNTGTAIREATERIAEAIKPEKIFLFGSHAWGTPTADSDIDLFVIVGKSDKPAYKRSRDAYRALRGMTAPIEVIVRTTEEIQKKQLVVTSLTKKILTQGTLLYG